VSLRWARASGAGPAWFAARVLGISGLVAGLLFPAAAAPARSLPCQSWGAQPPLVGTSTALGGIAAGGACDVWVVGSANGGSLTTIQHWDGVRWTTLPSPSPGAVLNSLWGVAVVSANDAWSVGSYRQITTDEPLIEHWNGHTWSVTPSPTIEGSLLAVVAFGHHDAWAVGTAGSSATARPLILHWNGRRWKVQATPNVGAGYAFLGGVGGTGPRDLWAVGSHRNDDRTLALHWNGRRWTVVPSPSPDPDGVLGSVSAVAPDDVWAVGSHGPVIHPLVEHWNGHRWTVRHSPNLGPFKTDLAAVSMTSAEDGWAVGYRDVGTQIQNVVEHWNGHAWSIVPTPTFGMQSVLSGVVAVSPQRIWTAGSFIGSATYPLVLGCC